jgi:hypothetical protein
MTASETRTTKIQPAPGINKNSTELDTEGTYTSCDKVRFFYGKPEKIGGWVAENTQGTIRGVTRALHTWVDLDEQLYLGLGTNEQLALFTGGVVYDVTPIVASGCAIGALNTSAGDDEVVVSIPPGGAQVGDYFEFETVTASAGGINFSNIYQITSVEAGYFTFDASTSAVATSTNAGGDTKVNFLLPNGPADNGAAFGWGGGTWDTPGAGGGGWSEPRATGVPVDLRVWSLDNWGEDLLGVPRGGKIYRWEASAGVSSRATVMSSAAPSVVNVMTVAQTGRHVIAAGTHTVGGDFDPMLIRWSDSENFDKWVAAATNQAGSFRLENGSFIIGVEETRGQILIFTDQSLYEMNRVGGNSVFAFRDLGRHNGLISQNGSVDVNGRVFWMAYNSFQYWDGNLHTLPCSVQEYIFDPESIGSINFEQKEKVYCETNREFNEIWWFYPSRDSEENDRYVVFNFVENTWYIGTLERTAFHDVDIFARPYGVDSGGTIYLHEQGNNDDTAGLKATLLTSYFDIEDGNDLMFVDRYMPDSTFIKQYNVQFNYKKYPQASEEFTKGPFTITPTTRKIHPRVRGRQMQIRYSASAQNDTFRLGSDRIDIKPDGGR